MQNTLTPQEILNVIRTAYPEAELVPKDGYIGIPGVGWIQFDAPTVERQLTNVSSPNERQTLLMVLEAANIARTNQSQGGLVLVAPLTIKARLQAKIAEFQARIVAKNDEVNALELAISELEDAISSIDTAAGYLDGEAI